MTTTTKAIAYTCDIVLERTGEIITRQYQKRAISEFAAAKGIEIVAWFEDRESEIEPLRRSGVQEMLAFDGEYTKVLAERVWAFSRKQSTLEELFTKLDAHKVQFEATTMLWDCVSQKVRRRFNPAINKPYLSRPIVRREATQEVYVVKPARLRFAGLKMRLQPV